METKMLLDALLEFDAYTGVAITVTRDSTNILDMGAQRDMGVGERVLDLLCVINTTFAAAGAATLTVALQGAPNNAGVPGTFVQLAASPAYAVAQLIAGRELLRTPMPLWEPLVTPDLLNVPRFYKLVYTVAAGPMTAGKIASYLIDHVGRQANRSYPSGFATTSI
jgi:hypothetical protein